MKVLWFRLAVLAVVLTLPGLIQAQSYTNNYGIWTYISTNNAITIIGYSGPGGAVVIPSEVNGVSVTSLMENLLLHNPANVTNVTVPNTITNIDYRALDGQYMTAITVDPLNPVYSSSDGVLYDINQTMLIDYPADKAGDYTMPDTVANLPLGGGLWGRQYLTGILVSAANNAYSSLNGVLYDKTQSTLIVYPAGKAGDLIIPNTVTDIMVSAFADCFGLNSVVMPNSLTSIGEDAFGNCMGLTNVTIPGSLITIGDFAFDSCTNLNSVTFLNGVMDIGTGMFRGCIALTNIIMASSVADIGSLSFMGTSVTNVTIGSGVTTISHLAFAGCSNLVGVYFLGDAPNLGDSEVFGYPVEGGWIFDPATVNYLPGTTGWSNTFGGLPAVLWNPQVQPGTFGVRSNRFGFNITGTSNLVVVIEASTNLANPTWYPLQTNTLNGNPLYFTDPQWTNYGSRFYRLTWP